MKKKKLNLIMGILFLIVFLIILIILFIDITLGYLRFLEVKNNECLINIAENFCETQGKNYSSMGFNNLFYCKEKRKSKLEEYNFITQEIEECLGKK